MTARFLDESPVESPVTPARPTRARFVDEAPPVTPAPRPTKARFIDEPLPPMVRAPGESLPKNNGLGVVGVSPPVANYMADQDAKFAEAKAKRDAESQAANEAEKQRYRTMKSGGPQDPSANIRINEQENASLEATKMRGFADLQPMSPEQMVEQRSKAAADTARIRVLRQNPQYANLTDEQAIKAYTDLPDDSPEKEAIATQIQAVTRPGQPVDMSLEPLNRTFLGENKAALGRAGLGVMSTFFETPSRLAAQLLAPKGGAAQASEFIAQPMRDAKRSLRRSTNMNTAEEMWYGAVESSPQLAAQVAAMVTFPGSTAAFVSTAIVPVMSQSYNDTFDMIVQNGGDATSANLWGVANAAANGVATFLTNKVEYNFLNSNAVAQHLIKKHVMVRAMMKAAGGIIAEPSQEGSEQALQEVTEAITRAANNIEQKPFEEALGNIFDAMKASVLPGGVLGVTTPPRAMQMQEMAKKARAQGNHQAAQTFEKMAADETHNAQAQATSSAVADLNAQADAVLAMDEQRKVAAAKIAEAEAKTEQMAQDSLKAQDDYLKQQQKDADAAEKRRRDDEIHALKVEQEKAKLDAIKQRAAERLRKATAPTDTSSAAPVAPPTTDAVSPPPATVEPLSEAPVVSNPSLATPEETAPIAQKTWDQMSEAERNVVREQRATQKMEKQRADREYEVASQQKRERTAKEIDDLAKSLGGVIGHRSDSGSIYYEFPATDERGPYMIRVSDHYVPETPERASNREVGIGSQPWQGEVVGGDVSDFIKQLPDDLQGKTANTPASPLPQGDANQGPVSNTQESSGGIESERSVGVQFGAGEGTAQAVGSPANQPVAEVDQRTDRPDQTQAIAGVAGSTTTTSQIVPRTNELRISNMDAMPRGTGARYLLTIKGEGDELIAKQWKRKPPEKFQVNEILVDFEPTKAAPPTPPNKVAGGKTSKGDAGLAVEAKTTEPAFEPTIDRQGVWKRVYESGISKTDQKAVLKKLVAEDKRLRKERKMTGSFGFSASDIDAAIESHMADRRDSAEDASALRRAGKMTNNENVSSLLRLLNSEKSTLESIRAEHGKSIVWSKDGKPVKWVERNVALRVSSQMRKIRDVKDRLVAAVKAATPTPTQPKPAVVKQPLTTQEGVVGAPTPAPISPRGETAAQGEVATRDDGATSAQVAPAGNAASPAWEPMPQDVAVEIANVESGRSEPTDYYRQIKSHADTQGWDWNNVTSAARTKLDLDEKWRGGQDKKTAAANEKLAEERRASERAGRMQEEELAAANREMAQRKAEKQKIEDDKVEAQARAKKEAADAEAANHRAGRIEHTATVLAKSSVGLSSKWPTFNEKQRVKFIKELAHATKDDTKATSNPAELTEVVELAVKKQIDAASHDQPTPPQAKGGGARAAMIDDIIAASRKPLPEIVEQRQIKGSDGKWYSGNGVPIGVTSTGESRVSTYAYLTRDGTTVGRGYKTRQEAIAAHENSQNEQADDFRKQLESMDDERVKSQHDYWTGQAEQAARLNTPSPAKKPANPVAEKSDIARLRELKAKKFKTAGDEIAIFLLASEIKADPSKWKVGNGVGYYAGVATAKRRGSQVNRGFQIISIDPATKMAVVRQVADTGLTSTGGDSDRVGDTTVHVADLVRDKKYDGPAPAPTASPAPATNADPNIGREWDSEYGRQRIAGVVGGDLYSVMTVGTNQERRYDIKKIDEVVRDNEYRLTDEYKTQVADRAAKNQRDIEAERKAKEDADAKSRSLDGYVSTLPQLSGGKARKVLLAPVRADGVVASMKDHIDKLVSDGAAELSTREESIIKDMSRAQFNRATNEEQADHSRRQKAAGNKTVYLVGSFNFGKTGYDYAKHLIESKAKPESPKEVVSPLVETTPKSETVVGGKTEGQPSPISKKEEVVGDVSRPSIAKKPRTTQTLTDESRQALEDEKLKLENEQRKLYDEMDKADAKSKDWSKSDKSRETQKKVAAKLKAKFDVAAAREMEIRRQLSNSKLEDAVESDNAETSFFAQVKLNRSDLFDYDGITHRPKNDLGRQVIEYAKSKVEPFVEQGIPDRAKVVAEAANTLISFDPSARKGIGEDDFKWAADVQQWDIRRKRVEDKLEAIDGLEAQDKNRFRRELHNLRSASDDAKANELLNDATKLAGEQKAIAARVAKMNEDAKKSTAKWLNRVLAAAPDGITEKSLTEMVGKSDHSMQSVGELIKQMSKDGEVVYDKSGKQVKLKLAASPPPSTLDAAAAKLKKGSDAAAARIKKKTSGKLMSVAGLDPSLIADVAIYAAANVGIAGIKIVKGVARVTQAGYDAIRTALGEFGITDMDEKAVARKMGWVLAQSSPAGDFDADRFEDATTRMTADPSLEMASEGGGDNGGTTAENVTQGDGPTTIDRSKGELTPRDMASGRNVDIEADLAELNIDRDISSERKLQRDDIETVKQTWSTDKTDAMLADVSETGRQMDRIEIAATIVRQAQLRKEHRNLIADAAKIEGKTAADKAELKRMNAAMRNLEAKYDFNAVAFVKSKSDIARALAMAKATIDDKFDVVTVLNRAKIVKQGELTDAERNAFIAQVEAEVKAHAATTERLNAEFEQQAIEVMERNRQQARRKKSPPAEPINDIVERVKQLLLQGC